MRTIFTLLLLFGCRKSTDTIEEHTRQVVEDWRSKQSYLLLSFRNWNEFDRLQVTPISSGYETHPILLTDEDWVNCEHVELRVNFLPLGISAGRGNEVLFVATPQLRQDGVRFDTVSVSEATAASARTYALNDGAVEIRRGMTMSPLPEGFFFRTDKNHFKHELSCTED